tara:strand:- start:6409 stop:6783 length:375 start_codon:yes stop_codon:yes gene_type:complete
MGSFAIGAIAALIGVLSGQGLAVAIKGKKLDSRLQLVEDSIPELITRAEVQSAFAQMAEIEAQRIRQEQQAQQAARATQAFGTAPARVQGAMEQSGDMNRQINAQLAQLTARMKEMNSQLGIED